MYISLLSWVIAFFLIGFNGEIKKKTLILYRKGFQCNCLKCSLYNYLVESKQVISMILLPSLPSWTLAIFNIGNLMNVGGRLELLRALVTYANINKWKPGTFRAFSGFGSFPVNLIIDLRLLTFSRVCKQLFPQECPLSSLAYFQVGSTLLDFIQELTW